MGKIENTIAPNISTTTPIGYSISTTIINKMVESTIVIKNEIIESKISNYPVINIQTTIIEETEETLVVFLGISQLIMQTSYFTFNIYLISVKNNIFSKFLKFILKIIYNTNSKNLENYFANCALDEVNTKTIVNYKCKIQTSTDNMKQIKFRSDFKFDQKNSIIPQGFRKEQKIFFENFTKSG